MKMNENNTLENIISNVKGKILLTGDYIVNAGKVFLQHEYEDMGIKFVDENLSKKQKYKII